MSLSPGILVAIRYRRIAVFGSVHTGDLGSIYVFPLRVSQTHLRLSRGVGVSSVNLTQWSRFFGRVVSPF